MDNDRLDNFTSEELEFIRDTFSIKSHQAQTSLFRKLYAQIADKADTQLNELERRWET